MLRYKIWNKIVNTIWMIAGLALRSAWVEILFLKVILVQPNILKGYEK